MTQENKKEEEKAFKDFIASKEQVIESANEKSKSNLDSVHESRGWEESKARKDLAHRIFTHVSERGYLGANEDELSGNPQSLNAESETYIRYHQKLYSDKFAKDQVKKTVVGINGITLEKMVDLEQRMEQPLLRTVMDEKQITTYTAFLQTKAYEELREKAKKGKQALSDDERRALKDQVIAAHVKKRVNQVKDKDKKFPKSYYDVIGIAAQIDISQRDFGDKAFDERVNEAVDSLKESVVKNYKETAKKNGGDINYVVREGIKKLAESKDPGRFEDMTNRLYQAYKSK